jgi:hypothetical protein
LSGVFAVRGKHAASSVAGGAWTRLPGLPA